MDAGDERIRREIAADLRIVETPAGIHDVELIGGGISREAVQRERSARRRDPGEVLGIARRAERIKRSRSTTTPFAFVTVWGEPSRS